MTTFTIELTGNEIEQLQHRANQTGLTPEELLHKSISAWLDQPEEDFNQAADRVLQKNAELYRRLA